MTDTATAPAPPPPDDADGSPQPPPAQPPEQAATPAPSGAPGVGSNAAPEETTESKEPEDKRSVEEIAADYLIPISQMAIDAWKDDPKAYLNYAVETAKGLYPTLADKLSTGLTTKTLVDPYIEVAKQILGDNVQPNFMDPMWEKALDGGRDPKTGNPTLMPLSQWRQLLQTDPTYGYDKSPQSHQLADNLADTIHGAFTGQKPLPTEESQVQGSQAQPPPVEAQPGGPQ